MRNEQEGPDAASSSWSSSWCVHQGRLRVELEQLQKTLREGSPGASQRRLLRDRSGSPDRMSPLTKFRTCFSETSLQDVSPAAHKPVHPRTKDCTVNLGEYDSDPRQFQKVEERQRFVSDKTHDRGKSGAQQKVRSPAQQVRGLQHAEGKSQSRNAGMGDQPIAIEVEDQLSRVRALDERFTRECEAKRQKDRVRTTQPQNSTEDFAELLRRNQELEAQLASILERVDAKSSVMMMLSASKRQDAAQARNSGGDSRQEVSKRGHASGVAPRSQAPYVASPEEGTKRLKSPNSGKLEVDKGSQGRGPSRSQTPPARCGTNFVGDLRAHTPPRSPSNKARNPPKSPAAVTRAARDLAKSPTASSRDLLSRMTPKSPAIVSREVCTQSPPRSPPALARDAVVRMPPRSPASGSRNLDASGSPTAPSRDVRTKSPPRSPAVLPRDAMVRSTTPPRTALSGIGRPSLGSPAIASRDLPPRSPPPFVRDIGRSYSPPRSPPPMNRNVGSPTSLTRNVGSPKGISRTRSPPRSPQLGSPPSAMRSPGSPSAVGRDLRRSLSKNSRYRSLSADSVDRNVNTDRGSIDKVRHGSESSTIRAIEESMAGLYRGNVDKSDKARFVSENGIPAHGLAAVARAWASGARSGPFQEAPGGGGELTGKATQEGGRAFPEYQQVRPRGASQKKFATQEGGRAFPEYHQVKPGSPCVNGLQRPTAQISHSNVPTVASSRCSEAAVPGEAWRRQGPDAKKQKSVCKTSTSRSPESTEASDQDLPHFGVHVAPSSPGPQRTRSGIPPAPTFSLRDTVQQPGEIGKVGQNLSPAAAALAAAAAAAAAVDAVIASGKQARSSPSQPGKPASSKWDVWEAALQRSER